MACLLCHIPWKPALISCDVVPALGSQTTRAITPHKCNRMDGEWEREECYKEPESENINVFFFFGVPTQSLSPTLSTRSLFTEERKRVSTEQQVCLSLFWMCYFIPTQWINLDGTQSFMSPERKMLFVLADHAQADVRWLSSILWHQWRLQRLAKKTDAHAVERNVELTGNLQTGACANTLCSSISRHSLFCCKNRKRDVPSGSFQSSTSSSVASAVKERDFRFYCTPDFNSISAWSVTVFIL